VADPAVFNASPVIFLARAGLTDLAQLAGEPLLIPRRVVEEIEYCGRDDPAVAAVGQHGRFSVVDPPSAPAIIERWDLGPGETAVLAWAYTHPGTVAVLDDLAARRCAHSLSVPVRGTLGLILVAKQRGAVSAARPILEQLRQSGMYLSDTVMNRALAAVYE
jgi:predicted nucleic acid-binding protein